MSARSSVASRLLACLVAVLLVGAGITGAAAAVAPVSGATELDSDGDSLEESTIETDDDLDNTTNDTTATVENTTEETVGEPDDDLEESTTETTTDLENTTDESPDGLEEPANETVDELEETITEPIEAHAEAVEDVTTDSIVFLDDVVNGSVETLPDAVGTDLDASVDGGDSSEDADEAGEGTDESDDSSGGTSTATDAVLVGLLGAITASGAAVSGASAGAGAGAGAGTGAGGGVSGAAGGVGTLLARRLSQTGELRHPRRVGSMIPWEFGPLFGYSRYDDSDPFENDRRRTIYGTIQADPGSYLSQVSEESDVAFSTVRHHVRVLEEEGLVTTAKINGKRRYFLADSERSTGTADDGASVGGPELHAALAEPAKRDVLETLAELGPVSNGRLAEELERGPSTVSHHLSSLETAGLVVREQDGRSVLNELASTVEDALRDAAPPLEEDSAESSASAPADD